MFIIIIANIQASAIKKRANKNSLKGCCVSLAPRQRLNYNSKRQKEQNEQNEQKLP